MVRGEVTSVIFKGIHYEITVQSGKNEYVVQSIKNAKVGSTVGMVIEPDGIHIMLAEDHTNIFFADFNEKFRLAYNGKEIPTSVTRIIPGSRRLEDGTLVDAAGETVNPERIRVKIAIRPEDIEMSDDADAGLVEGNIANLIYTGDHYSYVIHTDLEQDFVVNDEYLWNMGDRVSLIMPVDKMTFTYSRK